MITKINVGGEECLAVVFESTYTWADWQMVVLGVLDLAGVACTGDIHGYEDAVHSAVCLVRALSPSPTDVFDLQRGLFGDFKGLQQRTAQPCEIFLDRKA